MVRLAIIKKQIFLRFFSMHHKKMAEIYKLWGGLNLNYTWAICAQSSAHINPHKEPAHTLQNKQQKQQWRNGKINMAYSERKRKRRPAELATSNQQQNHPTNRQTSRGRAGGAGKTRGNRKQNKKHLENSMSELCIP